MTIATATMLAVRIHRFGGPEEIRVEEAPVPEPGEHEVLVRVHAAGVNPVDWKIREGRLGKMELPMTLGRDFSGVIERVGSGVTDLRVGDAVLGTARSGSYAEFAAAQEGEVARKPAGLDDVRAAALPVAAMTAWQALVDAADVRSGQRVLVHAAAGGVGSFAVQFAKGRGAWVIGTGSEGSREFIRELGADEAIDYRTTPIESLRDIDVVLDTIGGETQKRSLGVLKRGGMLVSTVQPPDQAEAGKRGVRAVLLLRQPDSRELSSIAEMVEAGRVRVEIAATMPLREARLAQELSQQGHTRGKMVLVVAE